MKMKKDINRLIAVRVVEIIFISTFLIVSYPVWQNIEVTKLAKQTLSESNLNFTSLKVKNPLSYTMYPMSKTNAINKLEATTLIIENNTLTEEEYILSLKISKSSTLDYNCLNIAIDEKVMPLNSLEIKEDSANYYFVIDENKIQGDYREYKIKLWMDEKTGNEMQNKKLSLSFEIRKSVTKI